ncbi:ATP phosphoribosyltransferase domain-containing protein [Purpureocillium lilacinum]|uniref:ATP phosphoribosyltransferase domain-containing protein n=1 Tax=Purpureocillium lilacinum TaxID=33203 RepID=A0A179F4X5_PURLI|nr:ATP phosphoribosyltransferase domain-containing protein [Purpureocillium lilacinum]OAQ60401.1 ATP phosphoribosyltransferase domain-containing protein [Purpureocillium lilacinum]
MFESAYTIVLHGNDATGKSTLAPALKAAGEVVYARGDEDPALEDTLVVRSFDRLTLQLADDNRAALPESYTDEDGVHRRIVRIILDADVPVLQARLANRPSTDKWESEKALFYFRARFLELAAFYGLPVVDTGKKSVDETVSDIVALARNTEVLALFSKLALRTLTPNDVASLASRRAVIPGVDYVERLEEIIAIECGATSIFTPEDVRAQCNRDPGLVHALVNHYDNLHDANSPLRLRLVVEGESKQIYKVETFLTRHFDNHILVLLKPTIYSHSKQATAEIAGLSAIRATGSRLFLEMLHRAGVNHTYQGLNSHGLIWAHRTEITQIETVYKELCAGTDKHSFFGMVTDLNVTLPTGQYKRGPYVRFDWRNPNHTYKGINPATHPFYHLMEESIGKDVFYDTHLTARAKPFGDKCVPEELVHGVQAVEASVDCTMRIFFTIQHYLHQIGLEVQDGCVMLDPTGRTMWSEINQDCMRIKRREVTNANHGDEFDKDVWRAGGSSVEESILDKWTQLNNLLRAQLAGRPFHEHEMVTRYETYGLRAREVLVDKNLKLTPRYRALYERLAVHDRSRLQSVSADEGVSERLLALMQAHIWQLTAAVSPHNAYEEAEAMVRLVNTYARRVGLPPSQVSVLTDAYADAALARAATLPGSQAIGVTVNKYTDKTDEFTLEQLGVKLVRPEGRCLRVDYEIVDAAKFAKVFGEGVSVHFVLTRPKDMPGLLAQGMLDGAVTYSSVMDNFPTVARLVASAPDTDISLALIGRRGQQIDPRVWTVDNRARIVAEHGRMVRTYLTSLGVPPDTYEIQRVLGSSESYLVNDPRETYLLCDAIISTGTTLQANGLEVWQVVKSKGDIVVGLYLRL